MTRLVVLLLLGLLGHCGADLDLEEAENLNITLGDAGEETETTEAPVVDDLVLVDNKEDVEEETGDSEGGGGDFVDPADFVGSEVTERPN